MNIQIDLDRVVRACRWLCLIALMSYCAWQLNNVAYNTTQIFYCCATWSAMEQYTPGVHPMQLEEEEAEPIWELDDNGSTWSLVGSGPFGPAYPDSDCCCPACEESIYNERQLIEQDVMQADLAVVVEMQKDIDDLEDAIDEMRSRILRIEAKVGLK